MRSCRWPRIEGPPRALRAQIVYAWRRRSNDSTDERRNPAPRPRRRPVAAAGAARVGAAPRRRAPCAVLGGMRQPVRRADRVRARRPGRRLPAASPPLLRSFVLAVVLFDQRGAGRSTPYADLV